MNVGEKCCAILREAVAFRGKFVNLSESGSGGGPAGPRSALKTVLHVHGIMSAAAALSLFVHAHVNAAAAAEVCAECLAGMPGIPAWQFSIILSVFSGAAAGPTFVTLILRGRRAHRSR